MSQYTNNTLKDDKNTAWMQVLELIESGWTILDIGCSSGNLGEELIKSKAAVVDGIEIDHDDAVLARKKLRQVEEINIESQTNINKTFKEKYDAILFIDVIEHLVNPVDALVNVKNLLKPNGRIIFSIPNMAHISVRLALLEGDFAYTETGLLDKTHLHFYTGDEISRIFSESGLKIETFTGSSLQYPDNLLKERLKHLGLNTRELTKFKSMLKQTHGNIYQYVGAAYPVGSKNLVQPKVPTENAHEKDYKMITKMLNEHKEHIAYLSKSNELKDQHIKNLEKIIEDLRNATVVGRLKKQYKKYKNT